MSTVAGSRVIFRETSSTERIAMGKGSTLDHVTEP